MECHKGFDYCSIESYQDKVEITKQAVEHLVWAVLGVSRVSNNGGWDR